MNATEIMIVLLLLRLIIPVSLLLLIGEMARRRHLDTMQRTRGGL